MAGGGPANVGAEADAAVAAAGPNPEPEEADADADADAGAAAACETELTGFRMSRSLPRRARSSLLAAPRLRSLPSSANWAGRCSTVEKWSMMLLLLSRAISTGDRTAIPESQNPNPNPNPRTGRHARKSQRFGSLQKFYGYGRPIEDWTGSHVARLPVQSSRQRQLCIHTTPRRDASVLGDGCKMARSTAYGRACLAPVGEEG